MVRQRRLHRGLRQALVVTIDLVAVVPQIARSAAMRGTGDAIAAVIKQPTQQLSIPGIADHVRVVRMADEVQLGRTMALVVIQAHHTPAVLKQLGGDVAHDKSGNTGNQGLLVHPHILSRIDAPR